jgi:hypothetical protein
MRALGKTFATVAVPRVQNKLWEVFKLDDVE